MRMSGRTGLTAARLCCAAALALACAGAASAQAPAPQCNEPMSAPVSYVPLPGHPFSTISSPDGRVTARNGNAPLAFDTAKFQTDAEHARVGNVPAGSSPVGVAVVDDGKQVVITNSNRFARAQTKRQTLAVIEAARVGEGAAAVAGGTPAGISPREFGQSPDRRTLFVSNYLSDELEVIHLKRMPAERPTAAPSGR